MSFNDVYQNIYRCPHCNEGFFVDEDELSEQLEHQGYFVIDCPYCGKDIDED